ncbi:lipid asymmetry maintenance protein MlaB [Colwelliaceae bacterium 6441]
MFTLPDELTIAQVEEYKSQFIDFINKNDVIELDDSQVNRIDTVGIQLLLAAVIYIAAQNKSLVWQNKSLIISQSIKQLGINDPILNKFFNE